jgi:hypothetical protein
MFFSVKGCEKNIIILSLSKHHLQYEESQRLVKLNKVVITQMRSLVKNKKLKALK